MSHNYPLLFVSFLLVISAWWSAHSIALSNRPWSKTMAVLMAVLAMSVVGTTTAGYLGVDRWLFPYFLRLSIAGTCILMAYIWTSKKGLYE